MKTTTAGLRTHLDSTVTTLATIWRITRQDGVEFYFTDHDVDLVFEANTYLAETGYNRTAVSNDSSMSVDSLDVEGLFDDASITEQDVNAGLFDHAIVRISMVNWNNISQGEMKVRKGNFGEVSLTKQGIFRTELRGLTQALSQNIMQVYTPDCRADLGDVQCGIPILNDLIQRNTAVALGEVYRVVTNTSDFSIVNAIRNPSFEQDTLGDAVSALDGWTILSGVWDVHDSTNNGLSPDNGTNYLEGGTDSGEVYQDIPITNLFPDPTIVESGLLQVDFSIRRANSLPDDTGQVIVEYRDINNAFISTAYDSTAEEITPEDTWVTRSLVADTADTGTRIIRVRLLHTKVTGAQGNSAFDNAILGLTALTVTDNFTQARYDNKMYEVTVAGTTAGTQPTYDTDVGDPTVDGTATLVCREAWMRNAEISHVVDRRNIEIIVSDARAINDWFNGGGLTFETGPNINRTYEVKDYQQSNGALLIFLPVGFDMQVGQKIRLYPGCDKRLIEACQTKFDNLVNFRGEPFIPGHDVLIRYPDAR